MTTDHQNGRAKVLNIKARNEAINIVKLRKLANHSHDHPGLRICTQDHPHMHQISNCTTNENSPLITDFLLQSATKNRHFTHKKLPNNLKSILNTGSKYNLTLDTLKFSLTHKMDLP